MPWSKNSAKSQIMEKSNTVMVRELERQKERIRRLADDPAEQELEIRKRLKLNRPDEQIFITGEPEKAPAPKPPAR